MQKDYWVIFLVTFFAFLIGAAFVQYCINSDTKLTDLITSIATIVTVFIAWVGVGTWKKQLIAGSSLKNIEELMLVLHQVDSHIDNLRGFICLPTLYLNITNMNVANTEIKGLLGKVKVFGSLLESRSVINAQEKTRLIQAMEDVTKAIDRYNKDQVYNVYDTVKEKIESLDNQNSLMIEKLIMSIT